jgi:hypothetical protein
MKYGAQLNHYPNPQHSADVTVAVVVLTGLENRSQHGEMKIKTFL